jgi:hypothetical protein
MRPVQLFCWHFMAYPYLPQDFDEQYDSGWVTVPDQLWDRVGASLPVLPGCGHSPHMERVQETVAAPREFFGAVKR